MKGQCDGGSERGGKRGRDVKKKKLRVGGREG